MWNFENCYEILKEKIIKYSRIARDSLIRRNHLRYVTHTKLWKLLISIEIWIERKSGLEISMEYFQLRANPPN